MHTVKVSYLSEEELTKYRTGAKCDLENRPNAKRDWKWRSEQGWNANNSKKKRIDPYGRY